MEALLPILAVIGALSPLLTLAWLWQVKEWRWDRLMEHLRREGWFGQLWGILRPAFVGGYLVLAGILQEAGMIVLLETGVLAAVALLTISRFLRRRQRVPVWTQKALLITATAAAITCAMTLVLMINPFLLPVVILLQPISLALSWLLWKPVDVVMKRRIFERARNLREQHPDLTVIGVTGSVGKTTTKELLACVLKDLQPAVTPAYVNSELGVARWMTSILSKMAPLPRSEPSEELAGEDVAVAATGEGRKKNILIVEMGAYRKGEISLMCSYVRPTIGVVTHVGTQHIALFGSQQNLFHAKAELVTCLPIDGRAFLNGDNDLCRKIAGRSPAPVTIVGTGGSADVEAFDIEETAMGIRFRALDQMFEVPLHGTHNVTNILLALAVGRHLGIPADRMRDLLKTFRPLHGTFEVREERGIRILDDTHNSSAASMKAAIAWARVQPEKEKVLLAAGLIEMGEMQESIERELGASAGAVFDRTVILDPMSARHFATGGATNLEVLSAQTRRVEPGSLLVCVGRMSTSTLQRLLP